MSGRWLRIAISVAMSALFLWLAVRGVHWEEAAAALRGALSDRARNGRIHAVTELVSGQTPSTKSAKAFLGSLTDRKQVLVVIGKADETGVRSVRNLPGVHILSPDQLNAHDVLRADDVVFSVEALNAYIEAQTARTEEVSA